MLVSKVISLLLKPEKKSGSKLPFILLSPQLTTVLLETLVKG